MSGIVSLEYLELHSPLLLCGVTLGVKLDPTKREGLVLSYDRPHQEVLVSWKDKIAIIPFTNVVSMIEGDPLLKESVKPAAQFTTKITAQVETPQGHVFKGPGHGKTGK